MQRCLAAESYASSQCTASAGSYHGWIVQPWELTADPDIMDQVRLHMRHTASPASPAQHTHNLNQAILQEAGEETGPLAEVEAWQERAKRLNGIHAQLGSPDIVRVGKVLEAAQSTYFSAFTRWEAGTL